MSGPGFPAFIAVFISYFHITAQPTTYYVDNTHSSIQFTVTFMALTEVPGRFDRFGGNFVLDESDMTKSKIELFIDVSSINTALDVRDADLRNDFFEAEKYPIIKFVSKSIRRSGGKQFEVNGDFTMHGITKEMTILLDIMGIITGDKEQEMGLKSKPFHISRKEFNITRGSTVGDSVSATTLIRLRTFYKKYETFHKDFVAKNGSVAFPFAGKYVDEKGNAHITLITYEGNYFIAFADDNWKWFNRVYQIGDNRFKLETFSHTFDLTRDGLKYVSLDNPDPRTYKRQ
jgi:polyisoprenoid-binding protein YceI